MSKCEKCEHNIIWFEFEDYSPRSECEFKEPFFASDSSQYCPFFENEDEQIKACYTC